MAYSLDQFTADCREILTADPGPEGRRKIVGKLESLLMEDDFIAEYCGADAGDGARVIFEDEALGFQVLAHIMNNTHKGGPHDHGSSWAIYGQAVQHTDMTEYRRLDDGGVEGKADIEIDRTYRLERGQAGIFDDGKIHAIEYPAGARFIRVTGCDLSTIPRGRYDIDAGTMAMSYRKNFVGAK
jgi:hypothetical protein